MKTTPLFTNPIPSDLFMRQNCTIHHKQAATHLSKTSALLGLLLCAVALLVPGKAISQAVKPDPAGIIDLPGATFTDHFTVTVTVTDGNKRAHAGQINTYTIVVTNPGRGYATVAEVNDSFPAIFTGVIFTATQTGGASGFTPFGIGNISDTVTMPAGSAITYVATGTISTQATGSISDAATVIAPNGVADDPNLASNTAIDTDTL